MLFFFCPKIQQENGKWQIFTRERQTLYKKKIFLKSMDEGMRSRELRNTEKKNKFHSHSLELDFSLEKRLDEDWKIMVENSPQKKVCFLLFFSGDAHYPYNHVRISSQFSDILSRTCLLFSSRMHICVFCWIKLITFAKKSHWLVIASFMVSLMDCRPWIDRSLSSNLQIFS